MRLIDTNVVIYATGKAQPLQDEARKVLDRIAEGSLHANVDVELLQEILHVYAARKERAKGFDTIDDLLVLFPNPIPIGREEIETARDLMHSNSFLGARDAIHAAVVQTHDLEGIVTADKVFDRIKGVKRFDLGQKFCLGIDSEIDFVSRRERGPFHVFPNNDGSELVFTLYRRPDVSDQEFSKMPKPVEKALAKLKTLLEK